MNNSVVVFVLVIILLSLLPFVILIIKKKRIGEKIDALKNNTLTMSPDEFLRLRRTKCGTNGKIAASQFNFPGVYIVHNLTKEKYYVGQGQKVLDRVKNHFTGHGNGDVYADYRYGDLFEISMIA